MPTESAFLLAGLFLLLAAAGWLMGRFEERDEDDAPPPINIDYLKGLNFLLNEQTDQALEHFLRMVRVDDKTIETHFALGSPVSYTHLTLPTMIIRCRSRWWPDG